MDNKKLQQTRRQIDKAFASLHSWTRRQIEYGPHSRIRTPTSAQIDSTLEQLRHRSVRLMTLLHKLQNERR
jgi:hypothetical protein